MKQIYLGQVNMSLMLFVEQVLTILSLTVAEKGEQGLRDATSRVSPGPRRAFVSSGVFTAAQYLTDSNKYPAYFRHFLIRVVRKLASHFSKGKASLPSTPHVGSVPHACIVRTATSFLCAAMFAGH